MRQKFLFSAAAAVAAGPALAQDTVTVAYFLEWPTANQVAQTNERPNGAHSATATR